MKQRGRWGLGLLVMGCAITLGAAPSLADIPPERIGVPNPRPRPRPAPKPEEKAVPTPTLEAPAPSPSQAAQPEPAPKEAVRLPAARENRLADGLFAGPMTGAGSSAELQLTVVGGFIVEALVRRTGDGVVPFDLTSVGTANAIGIRLQGSAGNEFVRVSGEIIDAERGRGTFDGVLVRRQVSGTWSVSRR